MKDVKQKILRVDGIEIDTGRSEIRRDGDVIAVEPQVFALIAYMAANSGRLVSRDELLDSVWDGRIVSESAISSRINSARKVLGDDGKNQRMIRTVPRKGYLFVPEAAVSKTEERPGYPMSDIGAGRDPLGFGRKPSIVVLPFENLSGDPEQSFFSDGIADDIITDLSRYKELFVIARQSAFAFHDLDEGAFDFAEKLGVSYLLEGSVRRASDKFRVTARLVDTATRETLWAEKFNRQIEDILDVQEEISTVIVNTLVGQVSLRHYRRVQKSGTDAIGAYDHVLRAQQHIWTFSRESAARAREEAKLAIELDPDLARAHAILGWAHHTEASNGWSKQGNEAFDTALECAKSAIAADTNEPWGHCVLGFSMWWRDQGRDFSRALEEIKLAVRLNPSNAHFRMIVGATLAYMGKGEEALREIDTAIRFNPLFPSLYHVHRARALFVESRYEEALADVERAAIEMPMHANVLALLAACYEKLQSHEKAAETILDLRKASPNYTVSFAHRTIPFANPKHLESFCSLLAEAGLPD